MCVYKSEAKQSSGAHYTDRQPAGVGDGPTAPADCRAPHSLLHTRIHTYTLSNPPPFHAETVTTQPVKALHTDECVGLLDCEYVASAP